MKNYQDLIDFMSSVKGKTIQDYNSRREEAKGEFPIEYLYKLDTSGMVTKLNLKPIRKNESESAR